MKKCTSIFSVNYVNSVSLKDKIKTKKSYEMKLAQKMLVTKIET